MRLLALTRVALGAQILVGLALFAVMYFADVAFSLVPEGGVREATTVVAVLGAVVVATHVALALAIPVLALVALWPGRPGFPGGPLQVVAQLAPLAPLALGLGFRLGLTGGLALALLHMALGLAAFGLVAAVQQRVDHTFTGPTEGVGHAAQVRSPWRG